MINNKEDLVINKLTKEELISVYTTHSVRHFPADERKPVSSISRMTEEGRYAGYGLYREKDAELLCYAFFTVLPGCRNILLDYFAVMEQYRSEGIGSYFLERMKYSITDCDGILIETENPDYARDESERIIRNKRISFYERNGAYFADILAKIFGVHYKILFLPVLQSPAPETLLSDFDAIYRYMVPQEYYVTHIHISAS